MREITKKEKEIVAYVQDMYGRPLMPMRSKGRVSRLLKANKAHIIQHVPLVIRLDYEPETSVVEDVILGDDPGRTNIGLTAINRKGEALYSSKVETRNKAIAALMRERMMHRRASRSGRRKARKRLARREGTQMQLINPLAEGQPFEIEQRRGHAVFSETGMGRRPRIVPVWDRHLPHYKKPVRM